MSTPRCPVRGCPVRYRSGEDSKCHEHERDATEAATLISAETAGLMEAPRDPLTVHVSETTDHPPGQHDHPPDDQ